MKLKLPFVDRGPLVAVIRLNGAIGTGGRAQLNDESLAPIIEKAFKRGKPKAVALVINSPGGSPVQSSLIAARIRRLAEEKSVPVHAFVEDVAASGGYWLASAADDIWVDESSIVGSIGVISAGFGAHVLLARQGVERRVYTAGKSKSMLDPFLPEKEEDVKRLKSLLDQMHETFTAQIKSRRGDRLADRQDLFTGEFWLGSRAVELGLADGVAHVVPKLKALYGDKVRFARYGKKRGLFQRFGATMAQDAFDTIEERAAYARFGL
ncbi:S49 family peptidase [Roseovarius indicus]|uniref:Multidrug transporter n=2 Tax=Roseovarius indicus TaxID=540747 RepID=A0A0T5P9M9_9RHOB|nr:S49 family peptidase [Roseovarius indicus]KRS17813.1 multidrug transporter [Roseovarius indicus]OAO05486.1 multidrug transporter [Roseovarius indicus]